MTETISIKNSEAITILKCLREVLLSAVYVPKHFATRIEQAAWLAILADQIANYAHFLDLYLTDSSENRYKERDYAAALNMLQGLGDWNVVLSDNESVLVVNRPTVTDLQSVKTSFPDKPKNAKAYHRWQRIDVNASQPTEFGPPDKDGNEIRP